MRAIRLFCLRQVLRLPVLHRTVSRRFLLLTDVDGHPLTRPFPVRYAPMDGDRLAALARPGEPWWRGLPTDGDVPVRIRHAGQALDAQAGLASGDALDEAVLRYLQKHPGEWRALEVHPKADADEVEAAARRAAVVVFSLTR